MFEYGIDVTTIVQELEKLPKYRCGEEAEAQEAFLSLVRRRYTSLTPELRDVLAFTIGFFAGKRLSGLESGDSGYIYRSICSDIANGHIKI